MTRISNGRDGERQEIPEDDNIWEDISDDGPRRPSKPRSTSSNSYRSPIKSNIRRRTPKPTVAPRRWNFYEEHASPVRTPPQEPSVSPGPPPRSAEGILGPGLVGALPSGVDVIRYVFDILGTVFRVVKTPISLGLATIACLYVISLASGAIRTALAPICSIPVIGLACPTLKPTNPNPTPNTNTGRVPRWPDFPRLLDVQSKSLEALLDESVEGPGLALEIKKAEMATSDLVTVVRVSSLNSREVLADSLRKFVVDARKVSRGLTRFSSRVGGAVDNVIAVNDYALRAIEAADARSSSLSRFLPFVQSESKQVVMQTFTEAMNTLSTNMQRLVLEAEVSISDLNKLEERLVSIHEVVSREDTSISGAKEELLAQLWTKLGGNRKELDEMGGHLVLLKGVGGYRDRALAHVVAALHMLETMAEDMEELRERVAAPRLVGETVPIDVHMKSLRSGLERLKGRRAGSRKMEEEIVRRIMGSRVEPDDDS